MNLLHGQFLPTPAILNLLFLSRNISRLTVNSVTYWVGPVQRQIEHIELFNTRFFCSVVVVHMDPNP